MLELAAQQRRERRLASDGRSRTRARAGRPRLVGVVRRVERRHDADSRLAGAVTTSASRTRASRIRGILASAQRPSPYRELAAPLVVNSMAPREPRPDFERLYRSHRTEVYRAALRKLGDHHEAEDVTQVAFLILQGCSAWLQTGSTARVAPGNRRERQAAPFPHGAPPAARGAARRWSLPSAEPPWRAQTEEIRAALATLAENQRNVFLLRELGGFSYSEIATQLDLSVPAVQMLLFRARQKLRAELAARTARVGGLIPIRTGSSVSPTGFPLGSPVRVWRESPPRVSSPRASASCRTYRLPSRSGNRPGMRGRSLEAGASSSRGTCRQRRANSRAPDSGRRGRRQRQVKGVPPKPRAADARPAAGASGASQSSRVGGAEPAARCRTECDPGDRRRCSCACPRPCLCRPFPKRRSFR